MKEQNILSQHLNELHINSLCITDRIFDTAVLSFTRLVDKTNFLVKVLVLKKFLIIIGLDVLIKSSVRGGGLTARALATNLFLSDKVLFLGITNSNTGEKMATTTKIAISIDKKVLIRVDRLVRNKIFTNRSRAIQIAIEEKISRIDKSRLAIESAKLNKAEEQLLSEESSKIDLPEWPEY